MARIPQSCPEAFFGRYTVIPGDTFYNIAQMVRVRFEALAANNPHITDPNVIYPGDVLCVPGFVRYPCCYILNTKGKVPFGTGGVVFLNFGPRGSQAVSFLATLPSPSYFGNFDAYTAELFIPNIGGFGNILIPTREDPPTWTVRIELPTAASVLPNSYAVIRPFNTMSSTYGQIVLEGFITEACSCGQ